MKMIAVKSEGKRIRKVKELILSAGNRIGVVHFLKRKDGKKRKMAYRLHVLKPTYATVPTGKKFRQRQSIDADHNQLTVFDVNLIRYNNKGRMCGRGEYRSIPLEGVTRIAVNGEIYKILS